MKRALSTQVLSRLSVFVPLTPEANANHPVYHRKAMVVAEDEATHDMYLDASGKLTV